MFARNIHDDIIRRLPETRPTIFRAQLLRMGPDRRRMRLQMSRAQSVVDLLRSIKIGIQRTFGVNHEFAPPRQADRKSTRLTPVTNAHLVCRLLLEKKKTNNNTPNRHLEHALDTDKHRTTPNKIKN